MLESPSNKALYLTGPALRRFEPTSTVQPVRQVNADVLRLMNCNWYKLGIVAALAITLAVGCVSSSGYSTSFVLQFPEDVDLGELWLIEDVNCFTCGAGATNLGHAVSKHQIHLPASHWFVSLRMPRSASHLMPRLTDPSLSTIGDLQLKQSDVTDDDLKSIAGINLRSIDLSQTKIRGDGLRYLKPNAHWTFVDLTRCDALDPQYLAHFKGWKRSTIRLVSYKSSGETYSDKELSLLDKAKQIICEGQAENICGTQIR
jgi:hypothetical protein